MRKKLMIGLTAAALTLGGLGTAVAGGKFGMGMDGGMMDGRMMDRLSQKLDLTSEQQDKVDSLIADNFKDMRQNMRNLKDLRKAMRNLDPNAPDYKQQSTQLASQIADATEKMVLMRADQRQAFNSILTPEQQTELAALKEKMQERWAERGKHHRGGEHGGKGKSCH